MIGSETIDEYLARLASRETHPRRRRSRRAPRRPGTALRGHRRRIRRRFRIQAAHQLIKKDHQRHQPIHHQGPASRRHSTASTSASSTREPPSGTEDLEAAQTASVQDALVQTAPDPAQLIKLAQRRHRSCHRTSRETNTNVVGGIYSAAERGAAPPAAPTR